MQRVFHQKDKRALLAAAMLSAACLFFTPSCKKETNEIPVQGVRDNLLGNWIRSQRARDLNGNHQIDSAEVDRSPATRATDTVLLSLVPDATYTRTLMFKGEPFKVTGTWHLEHSDSEILMQPSTSTTKIDTFQLDTVSQAYFLQHHVDSTGVGYYESYIRLR